MSTKVRDVQDTKQAMLEAGIELFLQNGYSSTGVQDVLDLVNIPKGCFYHYFHSKEAFAVAVVQHFEGLRRARLPDSLPARTHCCSATPRLLPSKHRPDKWKRLQARMPDQQYMPGNVIAK